MVHSFVNRTHVDLGIRTDHILTCYLPVPQSRLAKAEQTESFYRDLLAKLEAVPGVQRAAAATDTPLDDPNLELPATIVGKPGGNLSTPDVGFEAVTPGYFETLGVHIDRGRMITDRDTANSQRVAMVNEAFARRFLNDVDPLSIRLITDELQNGELGRWQRVERQVVGVFHDVQNSLRIGQPKLPQIWVPFAQNPWPNATLAVRTAIEPENMMKAIAGAVHSLDRNLPLADVKSAHQLVRDEFAEDRFGMALYGSLAGIALVLASLGIYGVMSFAVAQSASEIGLRIALGATKSDIMRRVLKQGLEMAGVGLGLGFFGAYATGRSMQSSLYGTGIMDWGAFSLVEALLLITALLACFLPARRASSVDPIVALRQD